MSTEPPASRRVVAVIPHGPDIVELCLERTQLAFEVGDCIALYSAGGTQSRPYSVASGTDADDLRFLVRRMNGGSVSPFLCDRKPGDFVRTSPPFGWFRPGANAEQRPFVFMATGTGVAPFVAYLRSPAARRPAMFWYGCRMAADLFDRDWLEERGAKLAVSRETAPGCHHGRITDRLNELPLGDFDYYLCGLDNMLDDVTEFLLKNKVPWRHIHRECFFNAPLPARRS